MITKNSLKKVVKNMKEGLEKFPTFKVDMNESKLRYGDGKSSPCGCHANFYSACIGQTEGVFYNFGAESLALDLGFEGCWELEEWALENPEIWGNEDGHYIFSDSHTFGLESSIFSAEIILNHWEGVLARLED